MPVREDLEGELNSSCQYVEEDVLPTGEESCGEKRERRKGGVVIML